MKVKGHVALDVLLSITTKDFEFGLGLQEILGFIVGGIVGSACW